MKYIFNPNYTMRHEGNKSLIFMKPNYMIPSRIHLIHPIYAMMLSFFNGTSFDDATNEIANHFQIALETVRQRMAILINNKNTIEGKNGIFPPNTLIEYNNSMPYHNYTTEMFQYDCVDLKLDRLSDAPSDILCNITMKCATDCIYCYADRKRNINKVMPIELLSKIIDEAKSIGVVSFKLIGGDVFAYKDWYELFKILWKHDFSPCISTKVPIREKHILALKEFGLDKDPLQISLDTLIKENLYKMLNVKDPYMESILKTFDLLDQYGVHYIVNTVLTKINDSIDDIISLEKFLLTRKNLLEWSINSAKCSMYLNKEYSDYKADIKNIRKIKEYFGNKQYNFRINLPSVLINRSKLSKEHKKKIFDERIPCSGNLSAMYILPDGKVTICEELYWHPNFILGDLTKQSITEVWKSDKALNLFYIKQNSFRKESFCSICDEFTKCRSYRHVCWRDIILAYGNENWDYPDLFCPHSPVIKKDIAME